MCGVWAETEAERHSQAKDNAVCVCRGCVCVCGGEAVCGVLCGPLASRVAQGVSGPSASCVWNPRVFADDARVYLTFFLFLEVCLYCYELSP